MRNSYVIQWKSKVNGRAGRGTKVFHHAEAEQLAEELNREHPQIEHEAVRAEERRAAETEQPVSPSAELVPVG